MYKEMCYSITLFQHDCTFEFSLYVMHHTLSTRFQTRRVICGVCHWHRLFCSTPFWPAVNIRIAERPRWSFFFFFKFQLFIFDRDKNHPHAILCHGQSWCINSTDMGRGLRQAYCGLVEVINWFANILAPANKNLRWRACSQIEHDRFPIDSETNR